VKIGVLDLQGAVVPHREKLEALGVTPVLVKVPADLHSISGIILPGGESTAMIHLLKLNGLWEPLKDFTRVKPTWGVCAGAILLAAKVTCPTQECFHAIEMSIERNAYGRQIDSFVGEIEPTGDWISGNKLEAVFIRAPRISDVNGSVKTLFTHAGRPVLVQQTHCLASTFHPELSQSNDIHNYFINHCRG
jgi:pyridoxal 5'-phosphate synthase pdxT subunit